MAAKASQREYAIFQRQLTKDLKEVMDTLKKIPKDAVPKRKRRAALRKAAKPMVAYAQAKAPVLRDRRKVTVTLKSGDRVTYYPSNLRMSIRTLTFRKTKSDAIFIGPKITKRRKGGDEYGKTRSKVDAYYAAMVEYGTRNMDKTPYMRPAYESTKGQVIQIATQEVKKLITQWANMNRK